MTHENLPLLTWFESASFLPKYILDMKNPLVDSSNFEQKTLGKIVLRDAKTTKLLKFSESCRTISVY